MNPSANSELELLFNIGEVEANAPGDFAVGYEDNPHFNDWFDEHYGGLKIEGEGLFFSRTASEILFEMDPTAYRDQLATYESTRVEEFVQLVIEEFPTPVAYHMHRMEYGSENIKQQLEFLRDVWEGLIYLLFAIVVGECRHLELSLEGLVPRKNDFLSNSLYSKLVIISRVIQAAENSGTSFGCNKFVDVKTIEKLVELNRVRNDFSHVTALSELQVRRLLAQHYPEVIDVLMRVEALKNVSIIRYMNQEEALSMRCETFVGSRMVRSIKTIKLTPENFRESLHVLNPSQLLAMHEDTIFSIAPFLHFSEDNSGHRTDIYVYKQKGGGSEDGIPKYTYEVIGQSQEITLNRELFKKEMDEIHNLLR